MNTANKIELVVANDFSKTPGPRYEDEGDYCGEEFRTKLLLPSIQKAIEKGWILKIVLDGTAGYGTSFLEEAFGGLIRKDGLSLEEIKKTIEIISVEEDYLIKDISRYMEEAENEKQ